jgi:hypothetical protein
MIDLIQSPLPHVPTEDYSHVMMGDEVMVVEIIHHVVDDDKAAKSSLWSEEGDQSGPEIFVFDGDGALVHEKLRDPGVRVFPYIRTLPKNLFERGHECQMGLHHAVWRWAHVVHPILRLVGPLSPSYV